MLKPLAIATTLLGLAVSAQAADLPVKPLAAKKKPAAASQERVLGAESDGPEYWLSGVAGVLTNDDGEMWSHGFGGYVQGDKALVGVRARFNRGFGYVRHGRELGFMLGQPLGKRSWYALGIGQFEFERRDPNNPERRELIGMPIEFVYAPGWSQFGFELRAEANINEAHPQFMLAVGARLGKLR